MYTIGIDLGGTNIAAGLVNESYEIMAIDNSFVHQKSESIYRDAGISYEDIINTIRKLLIK